MQETRKVLVSDVYKGNLAPSREIAFDDEELDFDD